MRALGIRRYFPVFADWLLTTHARWSAPRVAIAGSIAFALASAACGGNLAAASSGKVGCSPSNIQISDDEQGWGSRTWTATCNGRRYYCSATAAGKNSSDISCAPSSVEE